jgi:hypothetical protein
MDEVEAAAHPPEILTAADLIECLRGLPPATPVVVGDDSGIVQPVCEMVHAFLGADGAPQHLCTPDTPGAVEVFLL